jgi:hypothetical protein|tara:strand:- start:212 stop:571 length:360 start_codon:yes stop_codon:yes gene_type:complete
MKDKLGIFFSGLCVVHCVLFSLLIWGGVGSASFLSLSEELVHPILLVFVFIVGLVSFPSAYFDHKRLEPMALGLIGTIGLLVALFLNTTLEVVTTLLSGSMLIAAHLWNHRLRNKLNLS